MDQISGYKNDQATFETNWRIMKTFILISLAISFNSLAGYECSVNSGFISKRIKASQDRDSFSDVRKDRHGSEVFYYSVMGNYNCTNEDQCVFEGQITYSAHHREADLGRRTSETFVIDGKGQKSIQFGRQNFSFSCDYNSSPFKIRMSGPEMVEVGDKVLLNTYDVYFVETEVLKLENPGKAIVKNHGEQYIRKLHREVDCLGKVCVGSELKRKKPFFSNARDIDTSVYKVLKVYEGGVVKVRQTGSYVEYKKLSEFDI